MSEEWNYRKYSQDARERKCGAMWRICVRTYSSHEGVFYTNIKPNVQLKHLNLEMFFF